MPSSSADFNRLSSSPKRREFGVSGQVLWLWWRSARQQAIAANISPAEADWLLLESADVAALELRLGSLQQREQVELKRSLADLQHLWQRRVQNLEPVQYLTGSTPWRNFSLIVSPAVLIPRPETELIIDLAAGSETLHPTPSHPTPSPHPTPHWADLGTGSGAIALGLAVAFPDAVVHAVDCSGEALAIARANAAASDLQTRIQFYQGSWLEPLQHLKGKLSGILSNPPYIPSQMVLELQPEVTRHEPHLALDGGEDGLDCLRHLVTAAPEYLRSGGVWLVELMAGQAAAVRQLLEQNGNYQNIQVHPDLASIERFIRAYRR